MPQYIQFKSRVLWEHRRHIDKTRNENGCPLSQTIDTRNILYGFIVFPRTLQH